jgi:hypothetical protein
MVEVGVIPQNRAIFLERAHPAQAGWCGQASAFGELDIGDAAFGLEMAQNDAVDFVDRQP